MKNRMDRTGQKSSCNPAQNGFTLLECLLVLSIVVMLGAFITVPHHSSGGGLFSKTLVETLTNEQYLSLAERRQRTLTVSKNCLETEEKRFVFPDGCVCEPAKVSWNARGSISKGGTIRCSCGSSAIEIVMQLGSGRVRINES